MLVTGVQCFGLPIFPEFQAPLVLVEPHQELCLPSLVLVPHSEGVVGEHDDEADQGQDVQEVLGGDY